MTRHMPSARVSVVWFAAAMLAMLMLAPAAAGNPHFVYVNVDRVGDTLEVSAKEAGLGNETQVVWEVSALAECVNRGGNKPTADNKDAVSVSVTVPVQNGRAERSADDPIVLDGAAQIDPKCSPPMRMVYSDVTVTDVTHGVVYEVAGTF